MNDRTLTRAALFIAAAWAGLTLLRQAAAIHLNHAEDRAVSHYARLKVQSGEPLHPVRWGDRVLVPRQDDDRRQYAEVYLATDSLVQRVFIFVGDTLGRLPARTLHGAFGYGLAALVLLVAWRRR